MAPYSNVKELLGELLAILGSILAIQMVLGWLIRQRPKAAIAASVAVVFFCFFGELKTHCDLWLHGKNWGLITRVRGQLTLLGAIYLMLMWWLIRTRRNLFGLNRYLNIVSGALAAATLVAILFAPAGAVLPATGRSQIPMRVGTNPPDIYYILTDARTSPESLQAYWGYNDSTFVKRLTDLGFCVVKNAHGNSISTPICLSTYLNMDYPPAGATNQHGLASIAYYNWIIQHAEAPSRLKASGYDVTDLSVFGTGGQPRFYYFPKISTSSLGDAIWENTILGWAYEYPAALSFGDTNLRILSMLPKIAAERTGRPKFVYAHLIMPHQPFLFDQNGNRIRRGMVESDYRPELYLGQLIYENTLLTNIISAILKNSEMPPIIVLQGDHGFRNLTNQYRQQEATTILNALYLPGSKAEWLYPGITPVNTFRVIFNHYYAEHYAYLPDISRPTLSAFGDQTDKTK